jgi:hypothetical protein
MASPQGALFDVLEEDDEAGEDQSGTG